MARGPNLTSKAPNSEPGQCFKFRAENCGICIGHTFYPIELKLGVVPILVIENEKNRIKKSKIGFLLVPQPRGELR
jgi:hypothetical protein